MEDSIDKQLDDFVCSGDRTVIMKMLQKGGSPNARDPKTGNTLLIVAAQTEDWELFRYCLQLGAEPLRKNKAGKDPLNYATPDGVKKIMVIIREERARFADAPLKQRKNFQGPRL